MVPERAFSDTCVALSSLATNPLSLSDSLTLCLFSFCRLAVVRSAGASSCCTAGQCVTLHGSGLHGRAPLKESLLKQHRCSDHLLSHLLHSSREDLVGAGRGTRSGHRCSRSSVRAAKWSASVSSLLSESVSTRHPFHRKT